MATGGGLTTQRSDVVVVGAGVIGLAVALQLRKAGVERIVVVERDSAAGMGSTARANGGVRAQFATATNIAFSQYTIAALAELHASSGGRVGLRRIGYLLLTGSEAGADALQRCYELQRSMGVPVRWLEAKDVARLAPLVRTTGLHGATFCADDGVIDPHGVTSALCDAARELGVDVLFGERVLAIEPALSGARVRTSTAQFDADHVVNAAGPAARDVAALADVDLPVLPYRRNLACTEPIPEVSADMPMCVDLDTLLLVRGEAGGVLIGFANPEDAPTQDTSFDPAYLAEIAARAPNRFPFLEHATVNMRKCWAGLYPETRDHHAIIGAPATAPWFIQCAGFGGHGIMHSLAAGRAVAELVRDGRCTTFDLEPLRLERFQDATLAVETVVL